MLRHRAKLVAWSLSIGIHIALAVLLFRDDAGSMRTLRQPFEGLTRETTDDDSAFTFAIAPVSEAAPKSIAIAPPTGQRPVEPARPLPTVLQNLVRELGSRPPARVVVQDVTTIDFRTPAETGIATPPATTMTSSPTAPRTIPVATSVVYILDRSTSMGLTRETFDAARATVLASAHKLADDSRFQVIAYNGAAVRLLAGPDLSKKTEQLCRALGEALEILKPEGESRHDVALRAALVLGVDNLVFVTDADDDELAALRPILKGHGKPVAVSIVRVHSGRVSPPQAFR